MKVRLTAHDYEQNGEFISVSLFTWRNSAGQQPQIEIEAKTLPEIDAAIQVFGKQHAPCVVWAGAAKGSRKISGFDRWNSGTKNVFPAEAVVA